MVRTVKDTESRNMSAPTKAEGDYLKRPKNNPEYGLLTVSEHGEHTYINVVELDAAYRERTFHLITNESGRRLYLAKNDCEYKESKANYEVRKEVKDKILKLLEEDKMQKNQENKEETEEFDDTLDFIHAEINKDTEIGENIISKHSGIVTGDLNKKEALDAYCNALANLTFQSDKLATKKLELKECKNRQTIDNNWEGINLAREENELPKISTAPEKKAYIELENLELEKQVNNLELEHNRAIDTVKLYARALDMR
ncbi:MAG: hypothetical protein ACRC1M_06685 [Methanobacteriaceae archaeon]